jgi:hypothetical protein
MIFRSRHAGGDVIEYHLGPAEIIEQMIALRQLHAHSVLSLVVMFHVDLRESAPDSAAGAWLALARCS